MAGNFLLNESAPGVVVAAGLVVVTYNVWQLLMHSLRNNGRENKYGYGKFANFIDELDSEIKQKFDYIKQMGEEVERQVNNMPLMKNEGSNAVIDGLWISVRMIHMETEECKKKIAFGLNKIQEFQILIKAADDKVKKLILLSNAASVATSVAYIAFTLPIRIAAGAITLGNIKHSWSNYRSKNEGVDLKLKLKNTDFEQMQSELDRRLAAVENSLKIASQFRE